MQFWGLPHQTVGLDRSPRLDQILGLLPHSLAELCTQFQVNHHKAGQSLGNSKA